MDRQLSTVTQIVVVNHTIVIGDPNIPPRGTTITNMPNGKLNVSGETWAAATYTEDGVWTLRVYKEGDRVVGGICDILTQH